MKTNESKPDSDEVDEAKSLFIKIVRELRRRVKGSKTAAQVKNFNHLIK